MISYENWQLLNENFGYTLGVGKPASIGVMGSRLADLNRSADLEETQYMGDDDEDMDDEDMDDEDMEDEDEDEDMDDEDMDDEDMDDEDEDDEDMDGEDMNPNDSDGNDSTDSGVNRVKSLMRHYMRKHMDARSARPGKGVYDHADPGLQEDTDCETPAKDKAAFMKRMKKKMKKCMSDGNKKGKMGCGGNRIDEDKMPKMMKSDKDKFNKDESDKKHTDKDHMRYMRMMKDKKNTDTDTDTDKKHTDKKHTDKKHMGKKHMGKKYMGKKHMGKKYMGKKYMGKKYMGKKYMGKKYMGKKYMGKKYMGKKHKMEQALTDMESNQWLDSVYSMIHDNPAQPKNWDGLEDNDALSMIEDILLPPQDPNAEVQQNSEPGPGEVGYAPQGRVGYMGSFAN